MNTPSLLLLVAAGLASSSCSREVASPTVQSDLSSPIEHDLLEANVDFSDLNHPMGEPFAVEMANIIRNRDLFHLNNYQRLVVQKSYQNLSRRLMEIEASLATIARSEALRTTVTIPAYETASPQMEFELFIDKRLGPDFGAKVWNLYQKRFWAQNSGLLGQVQTFVFEKRGNHYSVVQRAGRMNRTVQSATFEVFDGETRAYFIFPGIGRVYWRQFEHHRYLWSFFPEYRVIAR